ncbi:MAG: NHLP bacteriocin export ABC transporter permease/ATPase subunit [Clostridia bacterium]|nr:NHLP bacteriocin export ABC transporter permease/ATPase subunit [Clostridia bacterium]
MGWFDEQIKQRLQDDELDFSQAFASLSGVVMGKKSMRLSDADERRKANDAIADILAFYHVKAEEPPEGMEDINDQLEYQLRPTGIMRRVVRLTGAWYEDAVGPLLGRLRQGDPVALLPTLRGYRFFHHAMGQYVYVTKKTAALLTEEAICFYRPLPLKKLTAGDLLRYMAETLSASDLIMIGFATLAATLLGLFLPYVNNLLFSRIVPSGKVSLLAPIACMLLGVTVSASLVGITKSLLLTRIQTKMDVSIQAAGMMRLLSLPADFFKKFSAGDLASRAQSFSTLSAMLCSTVFTTGLTSILSLVYVGQIARFASALVLPAMVVILVTMIVSILSTLTQLKVSNRRAELTAKQDGLVFALFSGVQKIKLAGAERRAFSKWAKTYKELAALAYHPPFMLRINASLITAVTLAGTIVLYFCAARNQVTVADYMAFNTSYGMLSGAFSALAGVAMSIAGIRSVLHLLEPILQTVPEVADGKKVLTRIGGGIEVSHVSFRYTEDMPLVLDDFSLNIRPGQYVAIVGRTGCGKSTLMRLLLGFERPQKGSVYYDGKDIDDVDLRSLRRNIGVVMQNGKLFQGDIFSNIVISAPWLTLDEAWRAAEMAGIAEDIRRMPMGMHTIISEGSGGISGGQRQRLMIARAVAPNPKVLMFDEATSALDNITQRIVSDSLNNLKCTRIVIAHRLSTIQHCDRIIVLEGGRIVEDGTYAQLIERDGFFARLVARQRLDVGADA